MILLNFLKKISLLFLLSVVLISNSHAFDFGCENSTIAQATGSDISYLESVIGKTIFHPPLLGLLLTGKYITAKATLQGICFFENRLLRSTPKTQSYYPAPIENAKILYNSILVLLKGTHIETVGLLKKLSILEDVKGNIEQIDTLLRFGDISEENKFIAHWALGIFYSNLAAFIKIPDFVPLIPNFNQMFQKTKTHLEWCIRNRSHAPDDGLMREVFYALAIFFNSDGDSRLSKDFLEKSGYSELGKKPFTIVTSFAPDADSQLSIGYGNTGIYEIGPYRAAFNEIPTIVLQAKGYGFATVYGLISRDRSQLIYVDTGTDPESMKNIRQGMLAWVKKHLEIDHPKETVLFTHGHWDHVGGHSAFDDDVPFYIRDNFKYEIDQFLDSVHNTTVFRPQSTNDVHDVVSFRDRKNLNLLHDDVALNIGGTIIYFIKIAGGETHDGLFFYLSQSSVLFGGDFNMPWFGDPFSEGGDLSGLDEAAQIIKRFDPRYVLLGHEPLNKFFSKPSVIASLVEYYQFISKKVRELKIYGKSLEEVLNENLIPDSLYNDPEAQLPFLISRDHLIRRIYTDKGPIFATLDDVISGLPGIDYHARLKNSLQGLKKRTVRKLMAKLIDEGKYRDAYFTYRYYEDTFGTTQDIAHIKCHAIGGVMARYQEDLFKTTRLVAECPEYSIKRLPNNVEFPLLKPISFPR